MPATAATKAVASLLSIACLLTSPSDAWARSKAARSEFQRQNPCPVTGKPRGPCSGYEVDHITPLKCKGADAPHNMQWLTVEQHKIKTRREAKECRH